ncbi:MAG: hypothetical protein HKN54_10135 [Flavobacteriaceae bacterium]|nr:hypothetical protein [Flavobacteriaceae bacterium]
MSIENQILKKAEELSTALGKARKDFIKNLITIGTGFLALFVGLKSENIDSQNAKYFFFITVVLLVIGIMFLTISLFLEIYFIRKNEKFLKSKMKEYYEKGKIGSTLFNFTKKPFVYRFIEVIGYSSFILSAFALLGYIFFAEFRQ